MFGKGMCFWLIQVIPGIVLVPLGDPFLSISSRCWRSWGGIYQCWKVRRLSRRNACDETETPACLGCWNLDYLLVIRTIDDFYIAPKTGILVLSQPVTELNLPLFLRGSLWYYKWVLHSSPKLPDKLRRSAAKHLRSRTWTLLKPRNHGTSDLPTSAGFCWTVLSPHFFFVQLTHFFSFRSSFQIFWWNVGAVVSTEKEILFFQIRKLLEVDFSPDPWPKNLITLGDHWRNFAGGGGINNMKGAHQWPHWGCLPPDFFFRNLRYLCGTSYTAHGTKK